MKEVIGRHHGITVDDVAFVNVVHIFGYAQHLTHCGWSQNDRWLAMRIL